MGWDIFAFKRGREKKTNSYRGQREAIGRPNDHRRREREKREERVET